MPTVYLQLFDGTNEEAAMVDQVSVGPVKLYGGVSSGAKVRALHGLDNIARLRSYERGEAICTEGRRSDGLHSVMAGIASAYLINPSGRRQIVDLLLPGDFFGFTVTSYYDFSVEAVVSETVVRTYPQPRLDQLTESDPQLARDMRLALLEAMERVQAHLLVIGQITARAKVGAFLIALTRRLTGSSTTPIRLPISRYDIADLLAITAETVSRSLTELQHRGAISLTSPRSLSILDLDVLGAEDSKGTPPMRPR